MDLSKLLMMILNPILRRLITRGVDAGFDHFAGPQDKGAKPDPQTRETVRRLRQTMRIGRKLW